MTCVCFYIPYKPYIFYSLCSKAEKSLKGKKMDTLDLSNESSEDICFDYIYEDLEEDIYRRTDVEDSLAISDKEEVHQPNDTNVKNDTSRNISVDVQSEVVEKFVQVQKENELLRRRISELFKTTKVEMERKDRQITELSRKMDDLLLKRNRPLEQVKNEHYVGRKFHSNAPSRRDTESRPYSENEVLNYVTQKESRLVEQSDHPSIVSDSEVEIVKNSSFNLLPENLMSLAVECKNDEIVSHPNLFSARMHNRKHNNNDRITHKVQNEQLNSAMTTIKHQKLNNCSQKKAQMRLENDETVTKHERVSRREVQTDKALRHVKQFHSKSTKQNDICLLSKTVDDNLKDPRLNREQRQDNHEANTEIHNFDSIHSMSTEHQIPTEALQSILENLDIKQNQALVHNVHSEKIGKTSFEKPEEKPILIKENERENASATQIRTSPVETQPAVLSTMKIPKKSNNSMRDTRDILSDLHDELQGSLRRTMQIEMGPKCDKILKKCEADLLVSTKQNLSHPKKRSEKKGVRNTDTDKDKDKYSERNKSKSRGERSPERNKYDRSRSKSRHDSREDRYSSRERKDKHESRAPEKPERSRSRYRNTKGDNSYRSSSKSKYSQSSKQREHKSRDRARSKNRDEYKSKDRREKSKDKKPRSKSRDRSKSRHGHKNLKDPTIEKLRSKEGKSRSTSKETRENEAKDKLTTKEELGDVKKSKKKIESLKCSIDLTNHEGCSKSNETSNIRPKEVSSSRSSNNISDKKSRKRSSNSRSKKKRSSKGALEVEEMVENLYKSQEDIDSVLSCEVENSIDQVLALANEDLQVSSDDEFKLQSNAKLLENKPPEDLLAIKKRLLAQLTNDTSLEEGEIPEEENSVEIQWRKNERNGEKKSSGKKRTNDGNNDQKNKKKYSSTRNKDFQSKLERYSEIVTSSKGRNNRNKISESDFACEPDNQKEITKEKTFNKIQSPMEPEARESKINIISNVVLRSYESLDTLSNKYIMEKNGIQEINENKNMSARELREETSVKLCSNKSFQIESKRGKIVESPNEPIKERSIISLDRNQENLVDSPNSSINHSVDISNTSLNESHSERTKKRIKPILVGPATSQLDRKSDKNRGCHEAKAPKLIAAMVPLDDQLFSEFDNLVKSQTIVVVDSSASEREDTSIAGKIDEIKDTGQKSDPGKVCHDTKLTKFGLTDPQNLLKSSSESEIELKREPRKLPIKKIKPVAITESSDIRITCSTDQKTEKSATSTDVKEDLEAKQLTIQENSLIKSVRIKKSKERENEKQPLLKSIDKTSGVNKLDGESKSEKQKTERRSKLSCKRKTPEKMVDQREREKSLEHSDLTIKLIRSRSDSKNYEISTDDEKGLSERVPNPEQHLDLEDVAKSCSNKDIQANISLSRNYRVSKGKVMENLKKEILANLSMSDSSVSKSPQKTTDETVVDKINTTEDSSHNTVACRGEDIIPTDHADDKQLINALKSDENARKLGNRCISKGKYMIRIQHTEDSFEKQVEKNDSCPQKSGKVGYSQGKRIDNHALDTLKKQTNEIQFSDSSSDSGQSLENNQRDNKELLEKNDEPAHNNSMPHIDLNTPVKKTPARKSIASDVEQRMINIFGEDITLDSCDTQTSKVDAVQNLSEKERTCTESNLGKLAAQTPLWKQMELSDDSSSDTSYEKIPEVRNQVPTSNQTEEIIGKTKLNQEAELNRMNEENRKSFDQILNEKYGETMETEPLIVPRTSDDISNTDMISKILSEEIKLKNPLIIEKKNKKSPSTKNKKRKAKSSPEKTTSKRPKTTFPAIRLHQPVRKSPRIKKTIEKPTEEGTEDNEDDPTLENQNKPAKSTRKSDTDKTPKRRKSAANKKRKMSCSPTPDDNQTPPNIKRNQNKTARKSEVELLKLDTPPVDETKQSIPDTENMEEKPLIRRRSSRSITPAKEVRNPIKTSADTTPISVNTSRRSTSGKSKKVRRKSEKILDGTFEEEKDSVDEIAACSPLVNFENMLIDKQSSNAPAKKPTIDVPSVTLTHDGQIPIIPVLHIEDTSFAGHCDFQNKSLLNFVEAMNVSTSNFHLLKESNSVEGKNVEQPNLLTFTNYLSSTNTVSTSTPMNLTKTQRCISFENVENENLKENKSEKSDLVSANIEKQIVHTSSSVDTQNSQTKSDFDVSGNSDDNNCSSAERKRRTINYTLGVGIKRSRTRRPVVEFVD